MISRPDFDSAVDLALQRVSPQTARTYRRVFQDFSRWLADRPIDDLVVGDYLASLVLDDGSPLSPSSRNVTLAAIKKLVTALGRLGYLDPATVAAVRLLTGETVEAKAPLYLTLDQLAQLLLVFDGESLSDRRNRALFTVMAYLGLRVSSIQVLTWGHLQRRGSGVALVDIWVKRGRYETKPLHPQMLPIIEAWQASLAAVDSAHVAGDAPMFPQVKGGIGEKNISRQAIAGILERARWRAGIDLNGRQLHPHALRHSIVRVLRQRGAPEEKVMRLTGHRSRDAFHRYAAQFDDEFEASALAFLPDFEHWQDDVVGQDLQLYLARRLDGAVSLVVAADQDQARRQIGDGWHLEPVSLDQPSVISLVSAVPVRAYPMVAADIQKASR
jgi:integrase